MLSSTTKRSILPFSEVKIGELEVESAAIFVFAEFSRNRGGGLISRQPQEKLVCLSKAGYPLWLFPKNNQAYLFNGLNSSASNVSYLEIPSAIKFAESLEENGRPREKYIHFLIANANYFQPNFIKKFVFNGLITDATFRNEFSIYRKENPEQAISTLAFLTPTLLENDISSSLTEFTVLQSHIREENERLRECLRLVQKTTSEYMTEIDYEASAATEETNAKIKAQEQIVTPQIIQLNKEYSRRIKSTSDSIDQELENLQKLKDKTERFIAKNIDETKGFQHEAKTQAAKGHEIFEKRWKEKIKKAQKELDGLKKEQKNIETSIKKLDDQKSKSISYLKFELDREIKLARQPILALEQARDSKLQSYKQETQKLLSQEKPVTESIDKAISLREDASGSFDSLSSLEPSLKAPMLFYVSFYVACYEAGLSRRYVTISPSNIGSVDFSVKIRSTLGIPKTQSLLVPRYKAISALIQTIPDYAKENTVFEKQLWDATQKANLLKTSNFLENAKNGLISLNHKGWLGERELQELSGQLVT